MFFGHVCTICICNHNYCLTWGTNFVCGVVRGRRRELLELHFGVNVGPYKYDTLVEKGDSVQSVLLSTWEYEVVSSILLRNNPTSDNKEIKF